MGMAHWDQLIKTGRFGPLRRNASEPLNDYPIQKLKTNLANTALAIFVGENDQICTPTDFAKLINVLPDTTLVFNPADYNHMDYVWAKDCMDKVGRDFMAFIDMHS